MEVNKMKTAPWHWSAVILLLAGCAAYTVRTDYDRDIDFSVYKTYDFVPEMRNNRARRTTMRPPAKDGLIQKRIEGAVDNGMTSKGFTKVENRTSDILIAFHTGVNDKVDVDRFGYHYGRRWQSRGVSVHHYKQGTLILDFIDRQTKELIWRGWATSVVDESSRSQEKIDDAVAKILAEFPPSGGK